MSVQQEKVQLTIRSALQTSHDFTDWNIECPLDWTILQLKLHLAQICDFKPDVARQRLIYAGRCLENDQKIDDMLRLHRDGIQRPAEEQLEKQVIHMVYIGRQEDPRHRKDDEGIRQRRNADRQSNQQNTPPPIMAQNAAAGQSMPHFGGIQQHQQSHEAWMVAYQNYTAQMMQFYQQAGMLYGMQQPHHGGPWWVSPNTMGIVGGGGQVGMYAAANHPQFVPFGAHQIPAAAALHQPFMNVPNAPNQQQQPLQMPLAAAQANIELRPAGPDFLDLVYKSIRFALLAMILYLYSSLERFFFVLSILALFWFVRARRDQQGRRNPIGEVAAAEVPREQAPDNQNQPLDGQMAPQLVGQPAADDAVSANAIGNGAWNIFFQTIQSFFASLIPENQAPLDIN